MGVGIDVANQEGLSSTGLMAPEFNVGNPTVESEDQDSESPENIVSKEEEDKKKEEEQEEQKEDPGNEDGGEAGEENPDENTDETQNNEENLALQEEVQQEQAQDFQNNTVVNATGGGNNTIENVPEPSAGSIKSKAGSVKKSGGKIVLPPGAVTPGSPVSVPENGPTIEDWKGKVSGETEKVEADELKTPEEVNTEIETKGKGLVDERADVKDGYQGDLEEKLPESPELEEEPKAQEDGIRTEAEAIIQPYINKKLANQSMPALVATPSGIMPKLGDSMEIIAFEGEMKKLENEIAGQSADKKLGVDLDELSANQEKLALMEEALNQVMPTVDGKSVPTEIVDEGAPPKIPIPEDMQSDIGDVVANLLADVDGKATEIMDTVRKKAYPSGSLHTHFPDMGVEEIPGLANSLTNDLTAIAEEAGLSATELNAKIDEEKEALNKEEADAQADLETKSKEQEAALKTQSKEEKDKIDEVKKASDDKALEQMEAAQGENDPEVIKQKAASVREDISTTVGKQKVEYDEALKRRNSKLTDSQGEYINAYNMAAVREKNTLEEPEVKEGETPGPNLEVAKVENWKQEQIRKVKRDVLGLKAAAKTMVDGYKSDLVSAATRAKDRVNSWEETESGKQKSWWQKLIDSFKAFFQEAKAEAQAWQQVNAKESVESLTSNINILEQAKAQLGENVTAEKIDSLQGITEEQKVILKAYYGDGPESGDSIAAVGKGLLSKITNEKSPEIIRRFTKELESQPSSKWREMNSIAKSINPSFSAGKISGELYAAMKGGVTGWGTDEDRVFAALKGLSPFEVMIVKHAYQDQHGASLEAHLESELGGAEKDRADALMESNAVKADAAALNEAMKGGLTGWGTDEDAIMTALRGKSEADRLKLIDYYKEQYGRDLTADLKDELGGHDIDRADALMEGDTAKADAIAIDQAMNGGMFGWGTDEAGIESVYTDIRNDAEGDAKKKTADLQQRASLNGWSAEQLNEELEKAGLTSAGIEQDILNRNAQTEVAFNDEYGGSYDAADGESALRLAYKSELSDSELDLANALADNDQTAADAARLANEFNESIFYASDSATNNVLENQYDRALKEIKTDEWPAIQMQLDERAKAENWDRYRIAEEKRKAEAGLEVKAQGRSMELMTDLETSYDSNYSGEQHSWLDGNRNSGGLRDDLQRYTQGYGEDKAIDLLDQGYLTPLQQIEYATNGLGTDEKDLKAVFEGKTQEEIEAIEAAWNEAHPNETLQSRVQSETSGREEFDTEMSMRGLPKDIHEDMQNLRDRNQYEVENQSTVKAFAYGATGLVLGPLAPMVFLGPGEAVYDNMFGGHEADVLRREMEYLERNYAIVNDPNASATDQKIADQLFGDSTDNFTAAVDSYREQMDSVANGVAGAVAITTAVVVGAVLTVLSGGAAGPGAVAAVSGVAGFFGVGTTTLIAVSSAATAVIASMATKKALLGDAYGDEAMLLDAGLGIIDVALAVPTAGMGTKVLKALQMGTFSQASASVQRRLLAFAITEYSEGALTSLPTGLLGELLNDENFRDGDAIGRILKNLAVNANTSGIMGVGVAGVNKLAIDPITNSLIDTDVNSTTTVDKGEGGELDIDVGETSAPKADTDDGFSQSQNRAESGESANPQVDQLTTDTDVVPYDNLSKSGKRARNAGYPDAPAGYNWSSTDGSNLVLKRNRVKGHREIILDPDTNVFIDKNTGETIGSAQDVLVTNSKDDISSGGSNTNRGGIDPEGFRVEAENAVANSRKIEDVTIDADGVQTLIDHLRQDFFTDGSATGAWNDNEIMISRLEKILSGEIEPTLIDRSFYAHETGEAQLMKQYMESEGMTVAEAYKKAHATISKEYGIVGKKEVESFYTEEAIAARKTQDTSTAQINHGMNNGSGGTPPPGPYSDKPIAPDGYHYNKTADGKVYLQRRSATDDFPPIKLNESGDGFYLASNKDVTFASGTEVDAYVASLRNHRVGDQPVVLYDKGARPDPSKYMSPDEISAHLDKFRDGASCFGFANSTAKYGSIGRPDGQFMMTRAEMDSLMQRTGGDIAKIEIELGIPEGLWQNRINDPLNPDKLIRVDVTDPDAIGLRMATGNEDGANDLWIPGGKTMGGANEAVVNSIDPNQAVISPTSLADMSAQIQLADPVLHAKFSALDNVGQQQFFNDFITNPSGYHKILADPRLMNAWNDLYNMSFYSSPNTKVGHDIRTNADFLEKYSNLSPEDQVKLFDYIKNLKAPAGRKGQVDYDVTRHVDGLGDVTIHYDKNGFPNFVDYCPQPVDTFRIVSDNLRGTAADFKLANDTLAAKFGFTKPYPKDASGNYLPLESGGYKWTPGKNNFEYNGVKYTWHHHQDGSNLFPVESRVHSTTEMGSPGFPHSGGDKLINLGLKGFFDEPDF